MRTLLTCRCCDLEVASPQGEAEARGGRSARSSGPVRCGDARVVHSAFQMAPGVEDAPVRRRISCARPRHGGGRQGEASADFGARDSKVSSPARGGPLQLSLSRPHRHHPATSSPFASASCLARGLDSPVRPVDCRRRGLRTPDPSRYARREHEATHLFRPQSDSLARRLLALPHLPSTSLFASALVRPEFENECSNWMLTLRDWVRRIAVPNPPV